MRPRIFALALTVATTCGFIVGRCSDSSTSPQPKSSGPFVANDYTAMVVHVTDGDTLVVAISNREGVQEKVRLLAIDTPERGQPGYDEARNSLMEIVSGKVVRLEFEDPNKLKRDKYGRVLAYVVVDGENANLEIVRLGWSAYTGKSGGTRFASDLVRAEEEARAAHRGIWALR